MMKTYSLYSGVLALSAAVLLAGCSLEAPTKMSQERVQVEHERFVEDSALDDVDAEKISVLAQHYDRHGEGPMELTVTYDPKSKSATAMKATNHVSKLVDALRKEGVSNVDANILPIKDSKVSKVLIAYDGYNALAPKNCELMAGLEDRNVEADEDYKLGCSLDTLFAQQLVRPKDLKGQGASNAYSDGRRASNLTESYRSGALNPDLKGKTATGE